MTAVPRHHHVLEVMYGLEGWCVSSLQHATGQEVLEASTHQKAGRNLSIYVGHLTEELLQS